MARISTDFALLKDGLQKEQHEHGQGKREGWKQKGKGDKREYQGIQCTEKASSTLCTNLADKGKEKLVMLKACCTCQSCCTRLNTY
jgi:hypothetical protein